MARRRTALFKSPSVTIWRCHLHVQWSDSSWCFPGCIPDARNMGQLCTQHVSLFGRSFAQRVWCHIWDHLHLSPDGGLSPKSVISLMMVCTIALQWALHLCPLSIFLPLHSPLVAQIPQLIDGALLQTTPALGDSPDGAMIMSRRSLKGICSCLSIAVSVTLLLEIWYTACPSAHGWRISERSGAADVASQSKQLPCGPGTRGFSCINSQGTLRAHVRFVGAVCQRISEPVP